MQSLAHQRWLAGNTVALLTLHEKERAIAPVLKQQLGLETAVTRAFDTDQLGTFTRERARSSSQQACARQKAQLACQLTGLPMGLGSEGSFGSGPYGDLLPWNVEMLVWVDVQHGWEVTAMVQGPACLAQARCESLAQVLDFCAQAPAGQGFVMRADGPQHPAPRKGLLGEPALAEAFTQCMQLARERAVFIEYDLRAHFSPVRMEAIGLAAQELARRLNSLCPCCQRPGFWPDQVTLGLPCAECHAPTNQVCGKTATCQGCDYQQHFAAEEATASPFYCPRCNP